MEDNNARYSQDLAKVVNSKRMYAKEYAEVRPLVDQLASYEVRGDLPPDLRREFEECLASGQFELGDPTSVEVV